MVTEHEKQLQNDLNKLFKQKDRIDRIILAKRRELDKLQEKRFEDELKLAPADKLTPEKVMALNWDLVRGKLHDRIDKWLRNQVGIFPHGYYPDTNQLALQVMFYRSRPLEDQLGILKFLPFIKPLKDGKKHIGVFESTLSEHGVYGLQGDDDSWELTFTRYGNTEVIKSFQTIDNALRYVYEHHPYEKRME